MVELGPSSIMKIARDDERPVYEPSKRRLTFPNGAVATTFTGEEPDQLRGPASDTVWIDELAKFKYPEETWDNMEMGLRLGDNPQVFCTTTPRPVPIIKRLVKDPTTIDIRFSTSQNAENLSPLFLKRIQERYAGTRLGRQELEGEILEDNPDALWNREIIENLRVRELPQLIRVVVGMDPAVTGNEKSDETGIIAGGLAANGHGYILQDASLRASPAEWARAGVRCLHENRADRIVGEVNNGGDLIEVNIRTVDRNIPFTAVHASRGKQIRAEPVAALYEQGRIHHVGTFPELEDQLCDWSPGSSKSPDRMDALVWCIWELFKLGENVEQNQQRVYVMHDDYEI
jgi:phage terminase large subunit-like protein